MPETRHCRYTNATEAVMHGLAVDVHATIDAGHDLPAGSTVVLRPGDVITMIDEDPEHPYVHAWLEDLDDEQWVDAVDARNDELAAERDALERAAEQDDEESPEPAQLIETVEMPPVLTAPAKAAGKKAAKASAPKPDAAAGSGDGRPTAATAPDEGTDPPAEADSSAPITA